MGSVIVHMGEASFISILVSAIESFPSRYQHQKKPPGVTPEGEVFGLLFGQNICRGEDTVYNVTVAPVLQIMKEKNSDSCKWSERHLERAREIVGAYPWLQFLGTFHSHPYKKKDFTSRSAQFSDDDCESACKMANEYGDEVLEAIIALTYLDKRIQKVPSPDWQSTTNYCGNYKYVLTSYITDRTSGKLKKIENLICPVAAGVGNYDLMR